MGRVRGSHDRGDAIAIAVVRPVQVVLRGGHGRTAAADVVLRTNRRAYTHNRKNIKSPLAVGPLEALVTPLPRRRSSDP